MPHPFKYLLAEYQFAIQHFAASVPEEVILEAQKVHDEFLANENVEEKEILKGIIRTGLAEYPHRRAFQEMTESLSDQKRDELVLDHVDDVVRARLKKHLDAGVSLEAIISSQLFETDFSPEERYQVEDAVLDAKDHVKEEIAQSFDPSLSAYKTILKKWEAERDKISKKIDELDALKEKDAKWKEEIEGKVQRFKEGFLLTERDVDLEEVEKEIEYWRGVLGEEI